MGADPDEDLVRRIGTGDPVAVRAMVARKLPRLLALATRMLGDPAEAEDVAQETFVRIWRHATGCGAARRASTAGSTGWRSTCATIACASAGNL